MRKKIYEVKGFIPDMGSYKTIAQSNSQENIAENALWDFNNAREHDGLKPLSLKLFLSHIRKGNITCKEVLRAP